MHTHFRKLSEIKEGFSPDEYHKLGTEFTRGDARKVMSRGELVEFAKCPARWRLGFEDEGTKAMEWGSLLDVLITQPGKFESLYAVAPKEYPGTPKKKGDPVEMKPWNWNSNFCAAWRTAQEAAGKTVVRDDVAKEAFAAQDRLMEDKILSDFIFRSRKQVFVMVEYCDKETGVVVPFKCLIDFVPPSNDSEYGNTIGDLKTTVDASPRKWRRTVFEQGWHIQAAVYIDAINAATGANYTQMAHVVSESKPPYEPARRILTTGPESFLQFGRNQYLEMLALYARCIKTGIFPGYDDNADCRGKVFNGWRFVDVEPWMLSAEE